MKVNYVYKITLLKGSLIYHYYIGKRTSKIQQFILGGKLDVHDYIKLHPDFDGYCGSGVVVQAYFKKYAKILGETYNKEIIGFTETSIDNCKLEETEVGKVLNKDPLCLNKCKGGLLNSALLGIKNIHHLTDQEKKWHSDLHKKMWCDINYRTKIQNSLRQYHDTHIGAQSGRVMSKESKEKLSAAIKNNINSKNQGQNNGMYNKRPTNAKSVLQYDLNGILIKEWPSASEAQRILSINNIVAVCNNKRRTAGGYVWKWSNTKLNTQFNSVTQYNLQNEYIATYQSAWMAAKQLNLDASSIYKACTGKCKTCGGFIWRFTNSK